jgi:hypothetical protein
MPINLSDSQIKAVKDMHNGCILCSKVGSGKSRTALAYYFIEEGGEIGLKGEYGAIKWHPRDLYIITTAKKRDSLEWEGELSPFLLSVHPECNKYGNKIVIDSWNNIGKYKEVENSFFIFDEDRVVGSGAWVKSFIKISKTNLWVMLSATPGDKWEDYIAVFVANGFYKNQTEFKREHVVYSRFSKFPKVDRYLNTGRLIRLRSRILVDMDYQSTAISHHEDIYVDYDAIAYKEIFRHRWDPWKNEPIQNASELCYDLRKICNADPSRLVETMDIVEKMKKVIIFYNFDYELELLKNALEPGDWIEIAEWNGHKHQPIPEGDAWVYLVQYTAGAEGWNCIKTNAVIFYSQTYSYRTLFQAAGRIDRRNTPFTDLYYYHLKSHASIDIAISRALKNKKDFNETRYLRGSN